MFSMTMFSFKKFILQKLNAKSSIHTVDCDNEIPSSWSKYAECMHTNGSYPIFDFNNLHGIWKSISGNIAQWLNSLHLVNFLPKHVHCMEMLQSTEHHKQQYDESLVKTVLCWRWCSFLFNCARRDICLRVVNKNGENTIHQFMRTMNEMRYFWLLRKSKIL